MTQPPEHRAAQTPWDVLPEAKQVFQDAHYTVLVEERMRIIATVRSDRPYDSIAQLEKSIDALRETLDRVGRAPHALLLDVRAGPDRHDPEFEAAMRRLLPLWLHGFRRVGVLVNSVASVLRIQRHARQDGIERWPTRDAAEIVSYLAQK